MKHFKDMTAADFTSHAYSSEKEYNPAKKTFVSFFRVKHSDVEIPRNEITEGIVTDALLAVPRVNIKK